MAGEIKLWQEGYTEGAGQTRGRTDQEVKEGSGAALGTLELL